MNWTTLRNEFPVTNHWAFFDHAAVAPLSRRAKLAMNGWVDDLTNNGVVNAVKWLNRVEQVRANFATLLNAEPEEIAFVKNTSEGLGFIAEGLTWNDGDNVITAAEEYPSNIYPWMNLQSKGVEVRLVQSQGPRIEVDDILSQIDDRTRLVSLSFVEYSSGYRNDLDAIGQLCRERDIYFLVDGIQGLGVLPIDVKKTPIDFMAADGHKWLLGPEGAGVFFIRRELIEKLHPIDVGWNSVVGAWDFANIDFQLKPSAERWEGGTLNFAGIHGLGASLELLLDIGIDQVQQRLFELTDYLCEKATQVGLEVFSSRKPEEKSGIVSIIMPQDKLKEIVQVCRDEKIVINQRMGRIRVSPHIYNTTEEIDRLIVLLEKYHVTQ